MQVNQTSKSTPKFPHIKAEMLDRLSQTAERLATPPTDQKTVKVTRWTAFFFQ